jgi:hypothetical protein
MNNIKLGAVVLFTCISNIVTLGQWTYEVIDNKFDNKFKKAYTETDNNGWLMMEVGDPIFEDSVWVPKPFLALRGIYFCDDYTYVDIVFIVNNVPKKYVFEATKSKDNRIYFFSESIWTAEFVGDFKRASKCLIRVNQSYCTDEYYEFSMTGSTAAYNFITR